MHTTLGPFPEDNMGRARVQNDFGQNGSGPGPGSNSGALSKQQSSFKIIDSRGSIPPHKQISAECSGIAWFMASFLMPAYTFSLNEALY